MNEDQRKMLLPKDWVWVKLEDVCNIISGKNQLKVMNPLGKYPIYGSSGIFGYADEYICEAGTTIIGRKGTINSPIFVKTKFWNVDTAFGLSVKDNYDSKLLYYFCLSFNFHTLDKSTTIPSLAKRDLLTIDIPLPPKPIQQAIVSKIEELFSELDKGIENLRLAQQQLKTYRQSVLKRAFEGRLTNNNVKEGELPKGWKWVRLAEVSKVSGGLTKNAKRESMGTKVPFLRVANVYLNFLDLSEIHTIGINETEIERVKLEKDDLLFVEGNGSIDQIGRVALWNGAIENCVHQNHLIKARFTKQTFPKYALHFFCSKIGRDKIKELANSTSGLHTLSLGKISKLEFPLPLIEEQHAIVQAIEIRLSVADKMEENIIQSLQRSENLKQCILKKSFEGKLV